jgi:hypothetical protein
MQRSLAGIGLLLAVAVVLSLSVSAWAELPGDVEEFVNHLGFLGYESEEKDTYISVTHDEKTSFTLQEYEGGILVRGFYGGSEYSKTHKGQFLGIVNELNVSATVMRAFVDSDGDLGLEAWFPADYDKARFAIFVEAWQSDTGDLLLSRYDDLAEFLE